METKDNILLSYNNDMELFRRMNLRDSSDEVYYTYDFDDYLRLTRATALQLYLNGFKTEGLELLGNFLIENYPDKLDFEIETMEKRAENVVQINPSYVQNLIKEGYTYAKGDHEIDCGFAVIVFYKWNEEQISFLTDEDYLAIHEAFAESLLEEDFCGYHDIYLQHISDSLDLTAYPYTVHV